MRRFTRGRYTARSFLHHARKPRLDFSRPACLPGAHILNDTFIRAAEDFLNRTRVVLSHHPRRVTAAIAAFLLLGSGLTFAVANLAPDASQVPVRSIVEYLPTPDLSAQMDSVSSQTLRLYRSESTRTTDTADTLLKRLGVFDAQAAAFLRSDRSVQSQVLGRAGRRISVETTDTNGLLKLQARWSPEEDGTFQRLTVEKTEAGFVSRVETLPLVASARMASGSIVSSLFAATDDARVPDSIAVQMAEIFSGDIDFHRALRKGDSFSVVYEALEGDGEPLRTGRVLSAEFVNKGKAHQAMWFEDAQPTAVAQAQRKGAYYTLSGESLKRAFLASPMEISRVTSGFKMRFHPIKQVWKAHLGVDYAAPVGTPVRSVGDGVVVFAGVQSGFGNVIKIRHQGQVETVYAHLSRFFVRTGESVSQGQNVGAVGMTGWTTGPHLHFEYRVNGEYKDPQIFAQHNATQPLAAAMKPLFDKAAAEARLSLATANRLQTTRVE